MIKNVSIRNFKSIKELDFKAKRVNVFIGEPNTGKSNILEALGMFSLYHGSKHGTPIRYREVANLYYDNETHFVDGPSVKTDKYSYTLNRFDHLEISIKKGNDWQELREIELHNDERKSFSDDVPIKFYQFKVLDHYQEHGKHINPPYGDNLFDVLMNHKPLKGLVSSLLKAKGYRLNLRTKDKEIEISKEIDDVIYTYPYQSLSDTLQRIIFYWAIIETNKNSTILLEEPESRMSPFYIRDIADQIAHDTHNQYFLVTHNPYFLVTLVEKTKRSDLSVSVTYLEDYQTKLKQLGKEDLEELTDLDTAIFFNLDKFTEVESTVSV